MGFLTTSDALSTELCMQSTRRHSALIPHCFKMRTRILAKFLFVMFGAVLLVGRVSFVFGAEAPRTILPTGVEVVWDLKKAYHETTPNRERICLNGLWQWEPAEAQAKAVPSTNWGYFKVPGCWPGITDYMQKDCQTVYR